jgi:hypothetical protein
MQTYWGVEVYLHSFSNSALVGVPADLTAGEISPGTHRTGVWVAPEPVWMRWRGEKNPIIAPAGNPTPVVQSIAQ